MTEPLRHALGMDRVPVFSCEDQVVVGVGIAYGCAGGVLLETMAEQDTDSVRAEVHPTASCH
ncbi:hypothetical protein [Nocardioides sp. MH1]|uniref:hypothetical protein n=1 Tax=Nocardioides sp. MH1 TaxID=3242490 RepID=UPI00352213A1